MKWNKADRYWRNNWLSVYPKWARPRMEISPASYFDNRLYISFTATFPLAVAGIFITGLSWITFLFLPFLFVGFGSIYMHLPIYSKYDECDPPSYGFYLFHQGPGKLFDSAWWMWGEKTYCLHMPWSWNWFRTSCLRKDGTWETEFKGERKDFWDKKKWGDVLWSESMPYKYVFKDGKTVQDDITATIKVEQREWRWRGLMWCPFIRMVNTSIDVSFDKEVGTERGSWKGGVMGCGYTLKKNEKPADCLRRMEKERRFDR
jgi:hypothetical protein